MPEEQARIQDEEPFPFSIVVALFEDPMGDRPPTDPELAAEYAELVGVDRQFPVTVDLSGQLLQNVPWEESLPGKCVVSPELEILHCWSTVYNEEGLDAIRAHWEASGR